MDNDKQLGKLEAQVESLQRQMEQLSIDVKCVTDVMTKWKGAGVSVTNTRCFVWLAGRYYFR